MPRRRQSGMRRPVQRSFIPCRSGVHTIGRWTDPAISEDSRVKRAIQYLKAGWARGAPLPASESSWTSSPARSPRGFFESKAAAATASEPVQPYGAKRANRERRALD